MNECESMVFQKAVDEAEKILNQGFKLCLVNEALIIKVSGLFYGMPVEPSVAKEIYDEFLNGYKMYHEKTSQTQLMEKFVYMNLRWERLPKVLAYKYSYLFGLYVAEEKRMKAPLFRKPKHSPVSYYN